MNRRFFLAAGTMALAVPQIVTASEFEPYAPGMITRALAAGETVFVDYSATWCGTCRRQERVINALRGDNPGYDAAMTFVKVDWDTFKNDAVTTSRQIPRRSTLLVLRGDEELGRLVAGTSKDQIEALMNLGL